MVENSAENFWTQFHSYEIATVKFPINGSRTWNNNTKQLVTLGMNAMIGKPLQSNLKCARFYDKYQIKFKLMDQWSTSLHAPNQKARILDKELFGKWHKRLIHDPRYWNHSLKSWYWSGPVCHMWGDYHWPRPVDGYCIVIQLSMQLQKYKKTQT